MRSILLAALFAAATTPAMATEPVGLSDLGDPGDLVDLPVLDEDLRREFELDGRWISNGPVHKNTIVNGSATREFDQVAALVAQYQGGGAVFCSSTLVSADELITAAHCIDGMQGHLNNGARAFAVFGDNLLSGEIDYSSEIVAFQSHPDWSGQLESGADIAWIRFAQPYTNVEPMPLYAGSAAGLRVGEVFDFVGFGVTGDNRGGSGIKRTADIAFREVRGSFLISIDSEKNLCSGDSGGAGLRREGEGLWSLVGVNSFVFDTAGDGTSCFSGGNGITRVDQYRSWILQNTGATTDLTEPEDPEDPEDPVDPEVPDDTVTETTDFGDWDLPVRPPEEGLTACSGVGSTGGSGLAGLAVLGVLALRRRRRD